MRIGIVNDSLMAVESLRRVLHTTPQHQITWVAYNGNEAVSLCTEDTPDLLLMDLIMPVMDGVEATRKIMRSTPCAILVVTSTVQGHSSKVFEAMGAGALDVVATPVLGKNADAAGGGAVLLEKITRISKLLGIREVRPSNSCQSLPNLVKMPQKNCLVVIGSSTGGPQALVRVLSHMPSDFPASVIVIQHMDVKFTNGLASWLDSKIDLPVRLVREGDQPQPGMALFACTDGHLIMTETGELRYTQEPRDNFYHPSVDVFFLSVAKYWSGSAIGILLTGMGRDGAQGLLALRRKGWHTIAQDQNSCIVYGMPKAAAELKAAEEILPIDCIGPACINLLAPKKGIYHE